MFLIIIFAFIIVFVILAKLNSPACIGKSGENRVSRILEKFSDGTKFIPINNVIIQGKNTTSQIDHILVSVYGIFVIETKNYSGWIFGKENAENWLQIIFKDRYYLRNPVKQNKSHVNTLRHLLKEYRNAKYFSIVVFAGSAELKEIETNTPVIYAFELYNAIETMCNEAIFSAEQIREIADKIESSSLYGKEAEKQHIINTRNIIEEHIAKEMNGICPYCNAPLVLRHGRYGDFYGCSNYPKCRFTSKY